MKKKKMEKYDEKGIRAAFKKVKRDTDNLRMMGVCFSTSIALIAILAII